MRTLLICSVEVEFPGYIIFYFDKMNIEMSITVLIFFHVYTIGDVYYMVFMMQLLMSICGAKNSDDQTFHNPNVTFINHILCLTETS